MYNIFETIMHDACSASLQVECESLEKRDIIEQQTKMLSSDDVWRLSHKISALPVEYMNIVFFRYYFEFSPSDTSDILKIDNVVGKLRYIKKMLSIFMNLGDFIIDDSSMKEASITALQRYASTNEFETMLKPHYSTEFRRKLKVIKAAQSIPNMMKLMIKRVAVFILVCAISFSTAIAANAELRERFFHWVIDTFPQFSIFMSHSSEMKDNKDALQELTVRYTPDGFKLADTHELHGMLIYDYLDDDKRLTIKFLLSNSGKRSYYDTEDAEVREFILKDSTAYTWQKGELTYLIWSQDNIECHVIAQLSYEEVLKIAENIKK